MKIKTNQIKFAKKQVPPPKKKMNKILSSNLERHDHIFASSTGSCDGGHVGQEENQDGDVEACSVAHLEYRWGRVWNER